MALDSLFANVVSLTHLNGTDGSTTITDVIGGTWSASGGPTISTTQSKWGGASARLTGAGSLTGPSIAAFGTSNFCVEMWARANSGALTNRTLFARGSGTTSLEIWINGNGSLVVYGKNGALVSTAGPTGIVVADVWNHYALTRNGNVFTLWFNGVAHSTITQSETFASTAPWGVGGPGALGNWVGYIDDFRVTVGNARYTSAFSAPTEAFADSAIGDGGIILCPMPTLTASGESVIPTADFAGVMRSPTFAGYGGSNASLTMPMPVFAAITGGRGAATMPSIQAYGSGHETWGEAAFVLEMPAMTSTGYAGANGKASLGSLPLVAGGTGTVEGVGALAAVMPSITLSATGTVSTTGAGSPLLGMSMATLIGYGGALCSVTLSNGYTTAATGITGAIGKAATTLPLFELTATGTAQNYGSAEVVMPALVATPSGSAYLILPGFTLEAIGTAVVSVTYEAYALNLKHTSETPDELTHFTNYPFDKIIRYKNSYYGANNTGLYLLEGTTDFADPTPTAIPYSVKTKLTDFGTDQMKTPEAAIFGGRLGPDATVTVYTGETEDDVYAYTTPRGQDVQNYRQKFGKGLKARYYAFGIQGDGAMVLDTVSFDIAKLKRRI